MRILVNLILVIACLSLIWLSREELKPAPPQQNTHLIQKLPWDQFQRLISPRYDYTVTMQADGPVLNYQKKMVPIRMQKLQDYLDNWLLLPEPKLFRPTDSLEAYGFSTAPDLIFEFGAQKHTFRVGHLFSGNVFVLYGDDQVFLVPDLFKNNLLWTPSQFLHHSFYSDKDLPYKILRTPFFIEDKSLILNADGQTKPFKKWISAHRLLGRLSTLGASPAFMPMPQNCQPFIKTHQDNLIYGCPDGFYSQNHGLYYTGGQFTKELLINWDLYFFSDKLEDYLPYPMDEVIQIDTDTSLFLKLGDEQFFMAVNRLKQHRLDFSWIFETGTPGSITLTFRNGQKMTLTGYRVQINSKSHFAMLIKDRVLASFPLGILK
ncbi:MAG: hypothetical protein H3C47_11925 [Candidatus Cloacimonetes bacterium]|nr:hypothetical protein [Candidatus Cloacimonadota bacterium]